MITQVIRNQYSEIQVGTFCQFGVKKKTNTGGGNGGGGKIPSNEMHFTTTEGYLDYVGVIGDQIILSDGTIITIDGDYWLYDIIVPEGKHKVVLVETRNHNHVGLGGEALVEIHNFPTLSSVNTFDTCADNSSPNLVRVPTILPPNITGISYMFLGAESFNQDISMWDVSNVTDMDYMFDGATSFAQDLSQWCVSNIANKPSNFDRDAPLFTTDKHPVWGTCPV